MTLAAIVTTIINLSYWILLTIALCIRKNKEKDGFYRPTSVLICAKNEIQNLTKNWESWKGALQDGDCMVIVDDFSTDGSAEWLRKRSKEDNSVSIVQPSEDSLGKKRALWEGLQQIDTPFVALCDADCSPVSDNCIVMMASHIKGHDAVVGYAPFYKEPSFLNAWQRFECFYTALQYLGFAILGRAYMGVGRNMLVRKSSIEGLSFLDLKPGILSGDDDFLIQYIQKKGSISTCIHPESFMYSAAQTNWKRYEQQKRRHHSSAFAYPFLTQVLLAIFSVSHIISLVCICVLFWSNVTLGFSLLCVRYFILYFLAYFSMRKLAVSDLWKWFPFFDVGLLVFFVYFAIPLNKQKSW